MVEGGPRSYVCLGSSRISEAFLQPLSSNCLILQRRLKKTQLNARLLVQDSMKMCPNVQVQLFAS